MKALGYEDMMDWDIKQTWDFLFQMLDWNWSPKVNIKLSHLHYFIFLGYTEIRLQNIDKLNADMLTVYLKL